LIARIVAGDPEALGEAFEEHSQRVYRLAYGITRSLSDAEDVVQDVFAALPERLASFEGRASLGTWLHRVAVRAAMMRLRNERFLETVPLELAARRRFAEVTRPLDRVALERALNSIPDEYRTVIWLKVVEGWSHAEIGETLGITENASYQRLHRARRMLRAVLGEGR
jgi:RNA polymerase sigma factor (sigma-70 family)